MDEPPSADNIVTLRGTGIIPDIGLRAFYNAGVIKAVDGLLDDQFQPASIDLRLGKRAYRVRASFLPGDATVMECVKRLDGMPPIMIEGDGATFEKGAVYVVEIQEVLNLPSGVEGMANPKSSTGRLDVLTRLITNKAKAFDRIEGGFSGQLYAEVAPLTFSVVLRTGSRLNQLRLHRGKRELATGQLMQLYEEGQLVRVEGERRELRDKMVPLTVDLRGAGPGSIIGFKAKKYTNKIDVDRVGYYDPAEFWEPITANGGRLTLDKDEFYILATREEVGVPPEFAAEMVPYDPAAGEFRVHYAGFFDPGFGWANKKAGGSRAVLEVRSHGVSFTLEHGQTVGWLNYLPVAAPGRPSKVYGAGISSNYQGQGLALAKQFRPYGPTAT